MGLSNYLPNSRISQSGVVPNEAGRPVSPYTGQVIYQLDTLRTLVWNGTAWVDLSTGQTERSGLAFITKFTAAGTSRFLICDNIFSTAYDNYRIEVVMRGAVNDNNLFFQYLDSSGNAVTSNYTGALYFQEIGTPATTFGTLAAASVAYVGHLPNSTSINCVASLDIFNPYSSTIQTQHHGRYVGVASGVANRAGHSYYSHTGSAATHRGLRFDNGGASNITGAIYVYGYNQ
jgi:hypothetical protein